jgi:hypothetical protein
VTARAPPGGTRGVIICCLIGCLQKKESKSRGGRRENMFFFMLVAGLADEVTDLPRLVSKPCWRQYSGYLSTKSPRDTQLFYWYHEATTAPSSKPLVLWLNGGPGCSSLGGMFTELGPLVVGADGNVTFNPYSWNKLANVIFLEQPGERSSHAQAGCVAYEAGAQPAHRPALRSRVSLTPTQPHLRAASQPGSGSHTRICLQTTPQQPRRLMGPFAPFLKATRSSVGDHSTSWVKATGDTMFQIRWRPSKRGTQRSQRATPLSSTSRALPSATATLTGS